MMSAFGIANRQAWADSQSTTVRVSQIEARILSVKGVADISSTHLNGKAENLILDKYEIPVLEEVAPGAGS